jgi:hypothetical protein
MQQQQLQPSRIAFGACNDQDQQNSLWPVIESRKPAAFIWGGDAIYAGTRRSGDGRAKMCLLRCWLTLDVARSTYRYSGTHRLDRLSSYF